MDIVEKLVKTTLGEVEKALSTKTVVGEPITIGDATLIPVISVGFAFGAGGGQGKSESKRSGEGAGSGVGQAESGDCRRQGWGANRADRGADVLCPGKAG